jgi:hypothetical protein
MSSEAGAVVSLAKNCFSHQSTRSATIRWESFDKASRLLSASMATLQNIGGRHAIDPDYDF